MMVGVGMLVVVKYIVCFCFWKEIWCIVVFCSVYFFVWLFDFFILLLISVFVVLIVVLWMREYFFFFVLVLFVDSKIGGI